MACNGSAIMTAMQRFRPMLDRLRDWRWLVSGTALALVPKCLLCVAAYAGIGAALGLGGPEICGASGRPLAPGMWGLLPLAVGGIGLAARRRHPLTRISKAARVDHNALGSRCKP
ncbi:MAG: hypothetical protein JWQ83_991 [Lacunisphaera sp.]|nr:hypothetical protein [Lacunisphaera sp.]